MKIVFCLPGNHFTPEFLLSWTALIRYCEKEGIEYYYSRQESSMVQYVRNMCLGGDSRLGSHQQPFNGAIDYDYLMWIDSDMVFDPYDFVRLLQHDKDIVTGVYRTVGGGNSCGLFPLNFMETVFEAPPLSDGLLMSKRDSSGLTQIGWSGFGFMLIKKGVFESMNYPWFRGTTMVKEKFSEMLSEDVDWCIRIQGEGFKIYADPAVRPGHQKKVVL